MNNRSQTRLENNNSLPVTSDGYRPLAGSVEVISEINKVKSLALLQAINEESHAELARIDRLIIRKRVRRRADDTARRRK
jgi:hypothetical protein